MNESAGNPAIEMPRYRSHKTVWALEIARLEGDMMVFVDARYAPRKAANGLFSRYTPVFGDYFVVYKDGHESISPRSAFEEGYTREGI